MNSILGWLGGWASVLTSQRNLAHRRAGRRLSPSARRIKPHAAASDVRLVERLEDRTLLAVFEVNTDLDNAIAGDGLTTLREAIVLANATSDSDQIEFNKTFFAPGSVKTIQLSSALENLSKNVTITGPGADRLTIEGQGTNGNFRIFTIEGGVTATISGCVISGGHIVALNPNEAGGGIINNGKLTLVGCIVRSNEVSGGKLLGGGGIANSINATLLIDNCVITANAVRVDIDAQGGGGILNYGTAKILRSRIEDNTTNRGVGAGCLNSVGATLEIHETTIARNLNTSGHPDGGGGIGNKGNTLISTSLIFANVAQNGGGVSNLNSCTVTSSTISSNRAGDAMSGGLGGGFYNYRNTTLTIENCTITKNQAPSGSGGGISSQFQGTLNVLSTIVSGNTSSTVGGFGPDIYGRITSFDHSWIRDRRGVLGLPNDAPSGDPKLDETLSDQGGLTLVHALMVGSPAIDKGKSGRDQTDQRGAGFDRVRGVSADIGAYESSGPTSPSVSFRVDLQNVVEDAASITLTVELSNPSTRDVIVPFTVGGTAGSPSDFSVVTSSPLTIPADETTATITVNLLEDFDPESNETIVFTLGTPVNATLGSTSVQTVTIVDDDVAGVIVSQSGGTTTVTEGGATDSVTFALATQPSGNVTVTLTPNSQVNVGANSLTFTPGNWFVAQTVVVSAVNDSLYEGSQTGTISYSVSSGDTNYNERSVPATAVAITDNDPPPTVSLSLTGSPMAEAGGVATVTASLSGVSGRETVVTLGFTGTAQLNGDYTRSASVIRIPAGSTSGSLTLTAVQDSEYDPNEDTIIIDIESVADGTENSIQRVIATITDDDPQSTAAITGTVFDDTNGDGSKGSGETGLAGWTVYLDANNNGVFEPALGEGSTLTAADGSYALSGLPAGSYYVREVLQSGYVPTGPSGGSYFVSLSKGEAVSARDFGNRAAATQTITVNTLSDVDDGDNTNGTWSLREAINFANSRPGDDVIDFDPGLTGTIDLSSLLPAVVSNVSVIGPGANVLTIRRAAADSFGVFFIDDPAVASISGLTIADANRIPGGYGGAIFNAGALTVRRTTFVNNTAHHGGAIGSTGTLTVDECLFSGNTADLSAGAIRSDGTLTIRNSTFSNNQVAGPLGGVGGAIYAGDGSMLIESSTIYANSASDAGGGIYTTATSLIRNTIIASNFAGSASDVFGTMISVGSNLIGNNDGSVGFINGLNLDQVGTAADPIDPRLGPLQDNGGPTWTHALFPDSPAVDAGSRGGLTTDQRGISRPIDLAGVNNADDGSDIGAYELEAAPAYQPDMQIRFVSEPNFAGDNVYNLNGAGQMEGHAVLFNNNSRVVPIRLQNDGNVGDQFNVMGNGANPGWTVQYFDAASGGNDITSAVLLGIWNSGTLSAGANREIRAEVTFDDSVPQGDVQHLLITGTSATDGTKQDAVKFRVTNGMPQPDFSIQNPGDASYDGDNVYNVTGAGQAKSQTARAGEASTFPLKLQNDGFAFFTTDTYQVRGPAGDVGWTIRYFDAAIGGNDITAAVTSVTGWSSPSVLHGDALDLRIEVTPGASVPGEAIQDVLLTATSNTSGRTDSVRASVTNQTRLQPDLQISATGSFEGDDLYNLSGGGQTNSINASFHVTNRQQTYPIRLQNDGNVADRYLLSSVMPLQPGWTVTIFDAASGGNDITSAVFSGGWDSGLIGAGASRDLRAEVTFSSDVPRVGYQRMLLTATSMNDASRQDAVKFLYANFNAYADLAVRNAGEPEYLGNNIYNGDGVEQQASQTALRGQTATYEVLLQHDSSGFASGSFQVTGVSGSDGWTVTYFDALTGGNDITSAITGAGWDSGPLATRGTRAIRVEVTPPLAGGTLSQTVFVTATANASGRQDTIKATTTRNSIPTIAAIAEQRIAEDATTGLIPLTIQDDETATGELLVFASSNNTNLIPDSHIELLRTGNDTAIRVTPLSNRFGTATINVTVTDGFATSVRTFDVIVSPVNDAPTIVRTPTALNVYVLSGGHPDADTAVIESLSVAGHNATLGVSSTVWDGSQADLNGYDAVILLNNYNWYEESMPTSGQIAIANFVTGGGGLVTGEWFAWNVYSAGKFQELEPLLPAREIGFLSDDHTTYTLITPDPILSDNVAVTFDPALNNLAGTESVLLAKPGATVFYYTAQTAADGIIGWDYTAGRVLSFSTLLSQVELQESNYRQLFANSVEWAAARQRPVFENRSVAANALPQIVNFDGITAGTDEIQQLGVSAFSSNPSLLPHPVVSYSGGNSGSLTFQPSGQAAGTVTITVTVRDAGLDGNFGNGDDGITSQSFDVVINERATLTDDFLTTGEDLAVSSNVLTGTNGAFSDMFPSGGPILVSVTSATHGSVSFQPDGTVTYLPDPDFFGSDSFSYSVASGGAIDTATVFVTIDPVADITNDSLMTNEDGSISANLISGTNGATADHFESGTPRLTSVTPGAFGAVSFSANGSVTYTPAPNVSGTDQFTYTVTSGGVTETATVTVVVNSINDAPAGTDKTVTIDEDSSYVFTAADFGFSDPRDVPANSFRRLKVATLPLSSRGTLTLSGVPVIAGSFVSVTSINAGSLRFTPPANAFGANFASFTFQVEDDGATGGLHTNLDQSPNTFQFHVTAGAELSVSSLTTTAVEGNSGTTAFLFSVARTVNTNGMTAVTFSVVGAGASPADSLDFGGTTSGTIVFLPGEVTKSIVVGVNGDLKYEPNETFRVTLSSPSGNADIITSSTDATILNDDPQPNIEVSSTSGVIVRETTSTRLDRITVSFDSATQTIVITDPTTPFAFDFGVTPAVSNTVRIPLSSLTARRLTFQLGALDDQITISTLVPTTIAIVIDGGDGNDTVSGGLGNETISGGVGNDQLNGNDGNDSLAGGFGADAITGGTGNDTALGGDGPDSISGGDGLDLLHGEAGSDTIFGGNQNDNITGGDDNDRILGDAGADSIQGGNGNDTLEGGLDADTIRGGNGNDALVGGDGDDRLFGDANNDTIAGGNHNDSILGGTGDDILAGQTGVDTVQGEAGLDKITGGSGLGPDPGDVVTDSATDIFNTLKLVFSNGAFIVTL